ncbi:hypothetical protein AXY_13560 [Amphibacillus xylanus NBRC 15112]|uniref:Uncharacterized protein n=1 Tax=Amphibacillus xylanus (strain ATCC 51415 / DSM 6626 / JCM 7361 / LMG 17667 / NBRC 15112 / Ep01) TaxID=698758 RepID=K0J7J7_AMPXN|nr:hypothetical protein AXY_13560 [Amphibacillus xylanus NBRC 15112]
MQKETRYDAAIKFRSEKQQVKYTRLLRGQIFSMGRVIAVPARAEDPLRQALYACLS